MSRFDLATGTRHVLATGLTAPFFLTWLDAAETLLVSPSETRRTGSPRSTSRTPTSHVVASGLPARPSSVAMLTPGQILVCSDESIEEVDLSGVFQPAGPLLMGIGFVPFDKIDAVTRLADTTVDPSYFFQVHQVPFGGTLPLMVNHFRAYNDGARFYRVKVDGVVHTDPWTDEKWNGISYVAVTTTDAHRRRVARLVPRAPDQRAVPLDEPVARRPAQHRRPLERTHTIVLEFANAGGTVIETSTPLTIRIDNNHCTATVWHARGARHVRRPDCGLLHYVTKNTDPVSMPFSVGHPNGFATFSFTLIKGVNAVALPAAPPTSGPVSVAVSPITQTIQNLMGKCDVAGFGEWVYVAASATNGWWTPEPVRRLGRGRVRARTIER